METKNLPAVVKTAIETQKIKLSEVNLMLPTETYGELIGEYDKVTMEVLRVDLDPAAKEVYETDGGLALSQVPLNKIATALSIQWDPQFTGIVECTDTLSRAKATGVMRKPNGEFVMKTDEKTINLAVVEEECRVKAMKDAMKGNPDGKVIEWGETAAHKKYPKRFEPWKSDKEKDEWIEFKVRSGRLQKLKFKDELAMTGAQERVIRKFIGLKSGYSKEELEKPFVFPRIILDTNKMLHDPKTRETAIGMISGSTARLFGPGMRHAGGSAPESLPASSGGPLPEQIHDAEIVPDDPFADVSEPDAGPEEKRRKRAIDALQDYVNSGILDTAKTKAVQALLDDKTTETDKLEEFVGKCKAVESKQRAGGQS